MVLAAVTRTGIEIYIALLLAVMMRQHLRQRCYAGVHKQFQFYICYLISKDQETRFPSMLTCYFFYLHGNKT
jgi:hypothetical protein